MSYIRKWPSLIGQRVRGFDPETFRVVSANYEKGTMVIIPVKDDPFDIGGSWLKDALIPREREVDIDGGCWRIVG